MKTGKYTEKELREAILSSKSIRESLIKLNVYPSGGNYKVFHKNVKEFNIDTSHFLGLSWNKGQCFGPKRPIEDYLSNEFAIPSDRLKKRLIKERFFDHKCYNCNRKTWNGEPIPIELHHIDGNHSNNNLSNLNILCSNCHSLEHKPKKE